MMFTIHKMATEAELMADMVCLCPEIPDVLAAIRAEQRRRYAKREILEYEAALLYVVAKQYDRRGANFLEIGTCYGWSAAVLANAAPHAHITTMTPNPSHYEAACENLEIYPQIMVLRMRSQDLLEEYTGPPLDLIFVDGDHKQVALDLPWYAWLKKGGLMIHHDYSPPFADGRRHCRWVWDTLNDFAKRVHPPDVYIANERYYGMAGWYRRENETWPMTTQPSLS